MTPLPWSLLFVLVLCLPLTPEAKRQSAEGKPDKPRQPPAVSPAAPQAAKRPRNRTVPGSGDLTTKGGDRCTWETSGEGLVTLLVSCSTGAEGDLQRYWCRFAGKPDMCQAYGAKSSQYWKQLVGKLKKRHNACEGEKLLKAKTCKKSPSEAHMKLAQRSGEEPGPEHRRAEKGGAKKKGGERTERKSKEEKEGEGEKGRREEMMEEEGVQGDMDPAQSYCAEGWNSVCSFFVRFFEG